MKNSIKYVLLTLAGLMVLVTGDVLAKSTRAYDAMIFVFGALMMGFALTGVNVHVIITFVIAYLFIVELIYSTFQYLKKNISIYYSKNTRGRLYDN